MQLQTKLALSSGLLVATVALSAAVVFWGADRAAYNNQRATLGYTELTIYLRISEESSSAFERARRDLMTQGAVTFDLDATRAQLSSLLTQTREVIAEERALGMRADEEYAELERVAALSRTLASAFDQIRAVESFFRERRYIQGRDALRRVFATTIGEDLKRLLADGVADEREEVDAALEDQERAGRIAAWAAGASLAAMLVAALATALFLRQLRSRIRDLDVGATEFAAGRLDYRIAERGADELTALAHRFNAMAGELEAKRRISEDARGQLERLVAERTEELSDVNRKLRAKDETRRQFFADIGHELRTPITALRGEAEVALRAKPSSEPSAESEEELRSTLGRILDVAVQLSRFVDDIFLIARAEAGVLDMRREAVDLAGAARSALEQLATVAAERGATIDVDIAEAAPVQGDPQRLRQLVQILVDNALAHGPDRVGVRVALSREGEDWRLAVEDDGPGIDGAELDFVFNRFHRGAASARKPGAGLGLPIARSIVLAHGGRIWIESRAPHGLSVFATFPAAVADLQAEPMT